MNGGAATARAPPALIEVRRIPVGRTSRAGPPSLDLRLLDMDATPGASAAKPGAAAAKPGPAAAKLSPAPATRLVAQGPVGASPQPLGPERLMRKDRAAVEAPPALPSLAKEEDHSRHKAVVSRADTRTGAGDACAPHAGADGMSAPPLPAALPLAAAITALFGGSTRPEAELADRAAHELGPWASPAAPASTLRAQPSEGDLRVQDLREGRAAARQAATALALTANPVERALALTTSATGADAESAEGERAAATGVTAGGSAGATVGAAAGGAAKASAAEQADASEEYDQSDFETDEADDYEQEHKEEQGNASPPSHARVRPHPPPEPRPADVLMGRSRESQGRLRQSSEG
jgi:hypothetical protein